MPPMVRSEAAGAEARDSSCSDMENPPDEERLAVLEALETRAVTFGPAMRMAWLRGRVTGVPYDCPDYRQRWPGMVNAR